MIKKIYKKYEIIFNVVLFSIFPIAAFYLMEFYEHNPFEEVRFMAGFFNIILFELIAWILYFVTGRAKWALRAVFIVAMVFGLINHYVMLFRSTPFVPWDIFSIGTATSVASNYDFAPTAGVVVVTVIFIALIMLMHFVDFRIKWKFRFRLIPTVLGLLVMCLFVNALQDEDFQTDNYLYPFLFTPAYMTKVNGMAVTFAMDLKFVAVDKPDGYSRQKAKELLDSYAGTDDNSDAANNTSITDKSDYPNIIVVMDEAFSDLSVLGDFDTNTDYMPFVHSLEKGNENTITGYLNTSVCGGNTADTEFEFLTGNTMAFLPVGSIPYQQYIKSTTPSLASYLKSIGYATYAQHPYYGSGWNRDTVYPLLGFDNLSFMQDYSNQRFVRKYISDETSFDKIIETYENKPDEIRRDRFGAVARDVFRARGRFYGAEVGLYLPDPRRHHAVGRTADREMPRAGGRDGSRPGGYPNEYVRRSRRGGRFDPHDAAQFPDSGMGVDRQPGRFGRRVDRAGGRSHLHSSGRQYRRRVGGRSAGAADAGQVPEFHARDNAVDGRSPRQGRGAGRRNGYRLALAA